MKEEEGKKGWDRHGKRPSVESSLKWWHYLRLCDYILLNILAFYFLFFSFSFPFFFFFNVSVYVSLSEFTAAFIYLSILVCTSIVYRWPSRHAIFWWISFFFIVIIIIIIISSSSSSSSAASVHAYFYLHLCLFSESLITSSCCGWQDFVETAPFFFFFSFLKTSYSVRWIKRQTEWPINSHIDTNRLWEIDR